MKDLTIKNLFKKLAFYRDCVGKCKYKYWLTTCLRSCDMNAIGDACQFTMDLPRHQLRAYRMNANRSSFNS